MKNNLTNLKLLVFALCAIGLVVLYSASSSFSATKFSDYQFFFRRQVFRLILGLVLFYIFSNINYNFYKKYSKKILYGCWILIVFGYITSQYFNLPTSRSLVLFGKNFLTTSDLAKYGLIIYISSFIEMNRRNINNVKLLFTEFLPHTLITLILIFFQPDMSTTFSISLILVIMIYIAGINTRYLWYTFGLSLFVVSAKIYLTPFQFYRFKNWFTGNGDIQSIGSILALSNGGIVGNGLGDGLFKRGYLPAVHTDFILPVIGEEFGFIGIFSVFILFFIFLYLCIKILQNIHDLFGFFLGIGITMNVIVYFLINAAYVVGIFPTTGLALPFISYGGSHIILTLSSIGILINMSNYYLNRKIVNYYE